MINEWSIFWLIIGFIAGCAIATIAFRIERKEKASQHRTDIDAYEKLLADANERIVQLENDLMVSKNIVKSSNDRINLLVKKNKRLLKKQ